VAKTFCVSITNCRKDTDKVTVGFVVAILPNPMIVNLTGKEFAFITPAPVIAFVIGFVLYAVLAKAGLEPPAVEMPGEVAKPQSRCNVAIAPAEGTFSAGAIQAIREQKNVGYLNGREDSLRPPAFFFFHGRWMIHIRVAIGYIHEIARYPRSGI